MSTGISAAQMYSGQTPIFNEVDASSAYFPISTANPANAGQMPQQPVPGGAGPIADPQPMANRGIMGKPATWWLGLVIVFAVLVFVSRRFGGEEKFGNVRATLWNGVLTTVFIVVILNFLKVFFSYFKVKGLSELIAAA